MESWLWFRVQRALVTAEFMLGATYACITLTIAFSVLSGDPIQGWDMSVLFFATLVCAILTGYDGLRRQRRLSRMSSKKCNKT
jgi:membrane protein implicated in regulation of membrane protease activity